eukprot:scaffold1390_cov249-Pinguiococcus_pyrenoidosus.AAC.5
MPPTAPSAVAPGSAGRLQARCSDFSSLFPPGNPLSGAAEWPPSPRCPSKPPAMLGRFGRRAIHSCEGVREEARRSWRG